MNKSIKSLILEAILLIIIMTINEGIFISVISVLIHEFTHIIVGNLYGCKLHEFNVSLTGTNAKLTDVNDLEDFQKLNLYLSGPSMNLLIFILCFCISNISYNEHLMIIGNINLGLFIFNMIPAYPLDGSKILEIILSRWITYRKAKRVIRGTSYIFVFFLSYIFILGLSKNNFEIGLVLVSGLIIYSSYIEKKSTIYMMMDNLFRKGNLIEKYEYIENRSVSVSHKNKLLNLLKIIDRNKFNEFYILDEELKFLGMIKEDEVIEALKKYGNISLKEYLILKNEQ